MSLTSSHIEIPGMNIGRGSVDFKLSQGSLKVLIEVKSASNTDFWHGLKVQTI